MNALLYLGLGGFAFLLFTYFLAASFGFYTVFTPVTGSGSSTTFVTTQTFIGPSQTTSITIVLPTTATVYSSGASTITQYQNIFQTVTQTVAGVTQTVTIYQITGSSTTSTTTWNSITTPASSVAYTMIVQDANTNIRLAGATISLSTGIFTTDSTGTATMQVSVGTIPYVVNAAGYKSATGALAVYANTPGTVIVSMTPTTPVTSTTTTSTLPQCNSANMEAYPGFVAATQPGSLQINVCPGGTVIGTLSGGTTGTLGCSSGSVCGNPTYSYVSGGTRITLTLQPNTGYQISTVKADQQGTFTPLNSSLIGSTFTITMPSTQTAITLYVYFAPSALAFLSIGPTFAASFLGIPNPFGGPNLLITYPGIVILLVSAIFLWVARPRVKVTARFQ